MIASWGRWPPGSNEPALDPRELGEWEVNEIADCAAENGDRWDGKHGKAVRVQTQRTEQFLEPYYKVCEDIELFEVGLRSLRGCTRIVAEQLFVDGRKQSEITGMDWRTLSRRVVEREKETALQGIADVIRLHDRHRRGECGKTD